MRGRAWLFIVAALLCTAGAGARAQGNADRGAKLHEVCLQCHGTELYVPPRRKINTAAALRKEVDRWGRSYNPKLTRDEVDDLVAFLNRDFYQLAK